MSARFSLMLRNIGSVRILFDKCVPINVCRFLVSHSIETAAKRSWVELSNGELSKKAEDAGFEVLLTCDQKLRYQQNLKQRWIALVVVGSNRWSLVQQHVAGIAAAVSVAKPNGYTFIEVPLPPKS